MPEINKQEDDFDITEKEPVYKPMIDELVKHKDELQEINSDESSTPVKSKKSEGNEDMELEIKDVVQEEDELAVNGNS